MGEALRSFSVKSAYIALHMDIVGSQNIQLMEKGVVEVWKACYWWLGIKSVLPNSLEAHISQHDHFLQNNKDKERMTKKKKDVLMGELEQLLTLVKQKETKITNNDSNSEVVENKINKIVSGFKEMQSSIDVKYGKLQFVLAQVKLEIETLI
ncbi:hypothetical protein GmHk_03G007464 [Glycine max]|nr:hypothetical protein GmHk_03G007464 [Glycine max]